MDLVTTNLSTLDALAWLRAGETGLVSCHRHFWCSVVAASPGIGSEINVHSVESISSPQASHGTRVLAVGNIAEIGRLYGYAPTCIPRLLQHTNVDHIRDLELRTWARMGAVVRVVASDVAVAAAVIDSCATIRSPDISTPAVPYTIYRGMVGQPGIHSMAGLIALGLVARIAAMRT